MSDVLIRPRTDADLPALGQVLVEVHKRDGYPVEGVDDPIGWLVSDRLLGAWVAESDGRPVGHVVLSRPSSGDDAVRLWVEKAGADVSEVAVLGRMFVAPQGRGLKLGRHLTEAATAEARRRGLRAVLDVMAKDVAATHIYEALGWQLLGPITHRFGADRTEPAFAYVSPAE
jgi:GNAT superfamily N-acetyltransferase